MTHIEDSLKNSARIRKLHDDFGPALKVQATLDKVMNRGHALADLHSVFNDHQTIWHKFSTSNLLSTVAMPTLGLENTFLAPPSKLTALQEIMLQKAKLFEFEKNNIFSQTGVGLLGLQKAIQKNKELFASIDFPNLPVGLDMSTALHFKNFNYALSSIASRLARHDFKSPTENVLEKFSDITTEVVAIAESVVDETIVADDLKKRTEVLIRTIANFIKKYKKVGGFVVAFVTLYITIHQYIDFLNKPDAVTQKDLIENNRTLLQAFKNLQEETITYHLLTHACKVRLKPSAKASGILSLPAGYHVTVEAIHHKWVLIKYADPKDGLTGMGWVFKKYCKR